MKNQRSNGLSFNFCNGVMKNNPILKFLFTGSLMLLCLGIVNLHAEELWYQNPADLHQWEQALPLGNGKLGAMIFGGVSNDRIILNEDSLWSGWANKDNDREGAYPALVKMRQLLKKNTNTKEVDRLALEEFCSLYGYGKNDFGSFQSFCDANFEFDHQASQVSDYRRQLDLKTGIASVNYSFKDHQFQREYFCSYPDQALLMRFSCSELKKISFSLGASSLHQNISVTVSGDELVLKGQVETGSDKNPGMTFESRWRVLTVGGSVTTNATKTRFIVKNADEVVVIMTGATNYKLEYPDYVGTEPSEQTLATLSQLKGKSYNQLKKRHVNDYQRLFNRVELKIDGLNRSELPTDERLKAYKKKSNDRGLESLLFDYGRYLLISSSRPGSLPANLQGLWNNSNNPPWMCDYHLNINFQMNYWPVNSCNLGECAQPMIDWTQDLTLAGSKTAKVHYNARGWVAHHTTNVWGYTSPGPDRGVHMLEAESGAFLCQNIWDYYAYTQDKEYLEKSAWPILKGAAEFWIDNLQESEEGFLVVSPSYSPEHGPLSDGAYYQTMIVWDLFTHCIEASKILSKDNGFSLQLENLRDRLQPLKVGKRGQLHEWRDKSLEKNVTRDTHRHVSHMYSVYPGNQIVAGRDDELVHAAIKTMNYRGDEATGWSMGWKINLWARLLDGDHALKLVRNLISYRLYDNLWDSCPPFQIDGNFGYIAGVAEMLLQSHTETLQLLPALPTDWSTGSVKGLCGRGGYTIDIDWKDGELVSATIYNINGSDGTVSYNGKDISLKLKKGENVTLSLQDFS